ncbi:hypothetical protein KEHDKFFH_02295 [Marinobacter maroccanus]|uniref:Uncharacterized protein n=1 Tax=Marinobacter maroccanus TaxID=2055143 RepID=A0A2S5ZFI0_9GAMM|nr:hypothetical protein [Marinobacter maroccanus]PPI86170.1 hypothetical protein KEHDKFFH_02295 [Marinobacter maroccanus]
MSKEDYLAVIGDIADGGAMLQKPASSGIVSERMVNIADLLFQEIGELADAAVRPKPDNDE